MWIVSVIFNVGIITILGLSMLYWKNWQGTLGGSVGYLLFLLLATSRYHSWEISKAAHSGTSTAQNSNTNNDPPGEESEESFAASDPPPSASRSTSRRSNKDDLMIPLGLSMMYFLTNLVIGVPGAIAVFFAFPCGDFDPSSLRRQVYWKTNVTTLPEPVQEWISDSSGTMRGADASSASSFVQAGSMLYVYGTLQSSPPQLYLFEEVGVDPTPLGYDGVIRDLVTVTDSSVCFIHTSEDTFDGSESIFCGNHQTGFKETVIPRNRFSFGLTGINGMLWFFQIRTDYYVFDPMRGGSCNYNAIVRCRDCAFPACQPNTMKVMSLNVTTSELKSHSRRYTTRGQVGLEEAHSADDDAITDEDSGAVGDDDGVATVMDSDMFCDGAMMTRLRAFGACFLSALPVIFNSGRVWIKYAIPSSSVTSFVGLGYTFFCIWGVVDPWAARAGFRAWFLIGTPIWLFVCTYQLVVNPRVSKGPLWWSLYLITTGMVGLLVLQEYGEVVDVRGMDGHEIAMWLLDIALLHVPLLIIAILTKSVYISLLTFVAFLLLTTIMIWRLTDSMPDTFLYGGIAYCTVFVVATCVYRARARLHRLFFGWLSAFARHTCAIETTDEEEDAENITGGLLLNEAAEEA